MLFATQLESATGDVSRHVVSAGTTADKASACPIRESRRPDGETGMEAAGGAVSNRNITWGQRCPRGYLTPAWTGSGHPPHIGAEPVAGDWKRRSKRRKPGSSRSEGPEGSHENQSVAETGKRYLLGEDRWSKTLLSGGEEQSRPSRSSELWRFGKTLWQGRVAEASEAGTPVA